jgi:hypothetical protein
MSGAFQINLLKPDDIVRLPPGRLKLEPNMPDRLIFMTDVMAAAQRLVEVGDGQNLSTQAEAILRARGHGLRLHHESFERAQKPAA